MGLQSDVATEASTVLHPGFHQPEYRVHCGKPVDDYASLRSVTRGETLHVVLF